MRSLHGERIAFDQSMTQLGDESVSLPDIRRAIAQSRRHSNRQLSFLLEAIDRATVQVSQGRPVQLEQLRMRLADLAAPHLERLKQLRAAESAIGQARRSGVGALPSIAWIFGLVIAAGGISLGIASILASRDKKLSEDQVLLAKERAEEARLLHAAQQALIESGADADDVVDAWERIATREESGFLTKTLTVVGGIAVLLGSVVLATKQGPELYRWLRKSKGKSEPSEEEDEDYYESRRAAGF